MIVGIGIDITTLSRICSVHDRFKERFARRILHAEEMEKYQILENPDSFLAKRFAVKEAAVKALGTGEREGILLRDFFVRHDERGKPLLHCDGKALERCELLGVSEKHISISDEGDQVIAFVVLEK